MLGGTNEERTKAKAKVKAKAKAKAVPKIKLRRPAAASRRRSRRCRLPRVRRQVMPEEEFQARTLQAVGEEAGRSTSPSYRCRS